MLKDTGCQGRGAFLDLYLRKRIVGIKMPALLMDKRQKNKGDSDADSKSEWGKETICQGNCL